MRMVYGGALLIQTGAMASPASFTIKPANLYRLDEM